MKKIVVLFIFLLLPLKVNASSGYLVKSSVKTCPNGKLYGYHVPKNGNKHWHLAKQEEKTKKYKAVGNTINEDPCPDYNDNTLKSLKIDGNNIEIKDIMDYETYNKKIEIDAETSDITARVLIDNKELNDGENTIKITVSASYGENKEYILNVIKKRMDTSLKSLKIDGNDIEIKDVMNYETYNDELDIQIEPTDPNVVYNCDYEELVEGENNFTIIVLAKNEDISEYKLNVIKKIKEEKEELNIEKNNEEIKEEIKENNNFITDSLIGIFGLGILTSSIFIIKKRK